jgi:hypothetical protein
MTCTSRTTSPDNCHKTNLLGFRAMVLKVWGAPTSGAQLQGQKAFFSITIVVTNRVKQ